MKKIILFVMIFSLTACSMRGKKEPVEEKSQVNQEQVEKVLTTEEKIGKLQMFLYNNVVKKYIDEANKYSNYTIGGNLSANYNGNFQGQNMSADMNLKDYILKVNHNGDILFNGIFSGNISSMFKKINIKTKFDIINIANLKSFFVKLEETSFTGDNMIKDRLSMIENAGKHIVFNYGSDNSYQEVNYQTILEDFKKDEFKSIFEENWFRVYKKEGDKEYLIPTKHIMSKIASYLAEEFTDSDYEDFVNSYEKDMKFLPYYNNKEGYLSIIPNSDSFKKEIEALEKFEFKIYMNEKGINKINIQAKESEKSNFMLNYEKAKNLDIKLNGENEDTVLNFNLTSKLNENNLFEYIDGSLNYKDNYEPSINGTIKLENNKINIFSTIEGIGTIKLNGITDNKNKLETLSGNLKFMAGYVNLNFDVNIKDNIRKADLNVAENIKFELNFKDNNGTINFNMNEKFKLNFKKENKYNFTLKINGNNYFNMNEKFSVDIQSKEGKITGNSSFDINDTNIVYLENNGEYKEDNFILETSGKVNIGGITRLLPYNILFKNNIEVNSKDNVKNYNIDGNIFLKANDELLGKSSFNINGNHTFSYKDNFIPIHKPENYIDFKELDK